MTWKEVQQHFPDHWVVFEALSSESKDDHWHIYDVSVVQVFNKVAPARELHRVTQPTKAFAVMHTLHTETNIPESHWSGVRVS
jgi:hypothetical protein